jgi:hypothetical protein
MLLPRYISHIAANPVNASFNVPASHLRFLKPFDQRLAELVVRNSREVMAFSKLRRRHFDLCWLRRLSSDACCRAVRSMRGRYDRHSSSSAYGMELATDPEYASQ